MNQEELINAIITEVKRVLALRGVEVSPSSGDATPVAAGTAPASPAPVATAPAASVPGAVDQSIGSRDMTGKQVITQSDLEGIQANSITVTKKAIITPLAIDYARGKGITITRSADAVAATPGAAAQPVVTAALAVAPDFPGDAMFVSKFLASKGFQVRQFTGKSYESAVASLAKAVSSGAANFGVCVERTGMEGPIYANRNKGVRAVHCRETLDARAARVDIGADIIVLGAGSNPEAVIAGFIGL